MLSYHKSLLNRCAISVFLMFFLVAWVFGFFCCWGIVFGVWVGFFASDASFIEVKTNILGRESSSHHHTPSSAEAERQCQQENLSPFWPHLHRIWRQKSCQNEPANSRQLELPHPPGTDWRVSPDPSPFT